MVKRSDTLKSLVQKLTILATAPWMLKGIQGAMKKRDSCYAERDYPLKLSKSASPQMQEV